MTLKESTANVIKQLESQFGQREAIWMMRDIFEFLLGYTQVDIIVKGDSELSDFVSDKVAKIVSRLLHNEPLQYIIGYARFCGNRFKVMPTTLIPRPETEELTDMIIKANSSYTDLHILDIGTGSGCIAVTLARALKFATIDAIDISEQALEVAKENASTLKVKVNFMCQDILSMTMPQNPQYDIIVSNPPYIAYHERATMSCNVLDYEPSIALFVPNDDPLLFYRAIASFGVGALKPCGKLYLEANPLYIATLTNLLQETGYTDVTTFKDMQKRDRFVFAILDK